MPIRPPRLDDRRYEDLVAELVARIPAHTPEWTHARAGDPGRTLIELFAWLGDALLYRANLIPERQRLAFLNLLGEPLRPARPARGLVTVALKESEPPAAVRVRPLAAFSGAVPFEVRDEFTVLPLTAAAFYKRPTAAGEPGVRDDVLAALQEFHGPRGGQPGRSTIRPYVTTPLFTETPPVAAGFDVFADTTDQSLWLALLCPPHAEAVTQANLRANARAALENSETGSPHLLNLGFVPALPSTEPLEPVSTRAAIPHVWEITANTTGQDVDPERRRLWRPEYLALDVLADSTSGLTRSGVLRLGLPRPSQIHAPENDVRLDENAGVGQRPPRLDDERLAARLVAWIRLRPAPGATPPPDAAPRFAAADSARPNPSGNTAANSPTARHLRVVWAGVNVVEIEQRTTRTGVVLGESSGDADQEFALPVTAVEAETLHLQVEEDTGWVTWRRIEDLATLDRAAAASRDARVFQLDAEAGSIRFGDGMRGRIPGRGRRVRAAVLRAGGGAAGNLPAGTLQSVTAFNPAGTAVGPRLVVQQPLPLTGGAEAESFDEAERRLPARLRHRDRAVAADDYRTLARETPGVAIGRVELLPRFKPQQRFPEVPGVVSVMVLPARPLAPAPNPRADRPLLEAVHAWLDARRPLGTELYVIGCEYLPVAVSVAVTLADGAPHDGTLQAIKDALVRVLWPLPGGGFDQQGWPLGRSLSNRELAVEVARVAGVSEVAGVNLFRRQDTTGTWERVGDSRDGREQTLTLAPWQLPELLGVTVVADDAATGAPLALQGAPEPDDGLAVAVPVVPELC